MAHTTDPATVPSPPTAQAVSGVATLVALAVAGLVVSLQQTLVLPLLPRLIVHFHTSVSAVTWVFTATLLAGAVATPLLSRFGDMYGKKKMIIATLVSLVIGSVICALSNSLGVLIVGRAVQGISAAMIPLAIGTIRDTFPRERVMTAIGIVSATLGVGGTVGMLITGIIAQHTDSYRPIFWIGTAAAVMGLILVVLFAPRMEARAGGRPDVLGAGLLAGWLVCLLLGISEGGDWGWRSGRVLGLFAGAVLLCAAWVLAELRVREPLVRMGLLVGPRSLTANAVSVLLGFAMFGGFTLISNFVQSPKAQLGYGLSGSVLDVGLYMLPSTVAMMLFSGLAGRFEKRVGAAYTLAIGSLFVGASFAWLAVSHSHVSDVLVYSAIMGIGIGIGYAALGTLAVQHVPLNQSGIASGINSLVRTVGGSISGAVAASVLTANVIPGTSVPTLHAYVLCFVLVAVGGAVAAVIAVVHAVAYKHDRSHERPVSELPTSVSAELAAVAGDYGDVPLPGR